jgi:hypothetical protein
MPDNWSFVAAAYGLAAVVFIAYGRWLRRREHELTALSASGAHSQAVRSDNTQAVRSDNSQAVRSDNSQAVRSDNSQAVRSDNSQAVRSDNTPRSQPLSETGHPRPEPGKRPPLQ